MGRTFPQNVFDKRADRTLIISNLHIVTGNNGLIFALQAESADAQVTLPAGFGDIPATSKRRT